MNYLFLTFLKIGSTSFGGHMSLISVLQNQMIDKDKLMQNKVLLNGISLASILPGPFAVNVVTFIGYQLRGFLGAFISMFGILLPSFLLVYLLSVAYFQFNHLPEMINLFKGILPGVCVVILSVVMQMAKEQLVDRWLKVMFFFSLLGLVFLNSIYTIFILMIGGGALGYLLYNSKSNAHSSHKCNSSPRLPKAVYETPIFFVIILFIAFTGTVYFIFFDSLIIKSLFSLLSVFGGMSLTLFGGGYVFIPFIREIVVNNMSWLNSQEFADSIAIGQITPGPIMISTVFIGYKVQGFAGSLFATIGMFMPSGLLAVVSSRIMLFFLESDAFKAILKGVHAVAVGMIGAAIFFIGKDIEFEWRSMTIASLALLMMFKFKWKAIYIIPITGIFGMLLF